ncbi:hypothetical protein FOA52_003796 [Chlamydomonas sp. UWO 241]|nr:hypothetical protein FOA52_003796 [Chlamydomonas sp. UWO 241]
MRCASLLCVLGFVALTLVSADEMLAGGSHFSENEDANMQAATFALEALNAGHESRNGLAVSEGALTLVEIKSVSTQVVAGLNYHLLLTVRDANGKAHDVAATVWSRPWLEARNDATDAAWQLTDARVVHTQHAE